MRPHKKSFACGFTFLVILVILGIAMPAMACDTSGTTQNPQWYDNGWGHRKAITIDKTKVVSEQKDFPVMISLGSDNDLAAQAQGSGNDLVFTLGDGTTKVPCKVESYTSSNGALVAWVKVPDLSSASNTVLYMYYGNRGASNQQDTSSSTWTDTYKGNWRKRDIVSWSQTEYNNHNNPSSFYSKGSDEAKPQAVTPAPTPTPTVTPTPTPTPAADSGPTQTQLWNDCGWAYRKAITIDSTKVAADQADFPVLINLATDPGLVAHAQPTGNDILFTLGDEKTKVPHKIESYTSTTGALVAWVKVPLLSSGANTVLYMYYGNPTAATQQDTSGSWSYRYKGIWSKKAIESWIQTKYNNQMNPSTFYALGTEAYQPQSCSPTPVPTPTPTTAPTFTVNTAMTVVPVDVITAEPTEKSTPAPVIIDPTPTVTPTPVPTPAFACPGDSYSLVTTNSDIAGCVAVTNDWSIDEETNGLLDTLSVSYTMADGFSLKSADVAIAFTPATGVTPQYTQSFDASANTKSYTFSIQLPENANDVTYLYATAHGTVQEGTGDTASADMDVVVPENPIYYIIQG